MGIGNQAQRAFAATVGVVDWLAEQAGDLWQQRDRLPERLGAAYDALSDRGDARLRSADREARRQARQVGEAARRVPGVPAVEGEVRGLTTEHSSLPIADYDAHNVDQITPKLAALSQRELHEIEGYEVAHQGRTTVLRRIEDLRGEEPWPTYDEMNADEVIGRLRQLPAEERTAVAQYEQRHRNRRTVLDVASRG